MAVISARGDGPTTAPGAGQVATQQNRCRVFEEIQRIAADCDEQEASDAVGKLSQKDMEEIRQLHNPPAVVRRTLEATFLLLNAARAPARPTPPAWERVQKMLSNAGFLARMLSYDVTVLQDFPVLTAYVANEYFSGSSGTSGTGDSSGSKQRRSSHARHQSKRTTAPLPRRSTAMWDEHEPLTFHRVHRASHAAAALFRWSTTVLVEALDPGSPQADHQTETAEGEADAEVQHREPTPEAVPEPPPRQPLVTAAESTTVSPPTRPPAAGTAPSTPPPQPAPTPAAPTPQAQAQARPAPRPLPPKAEEESKPPPRRDSKPDRHFELMVNFVLGRNQLTDEGEPSMQTVAATYCMRRRLRLRLVPCPDSLENDALAKQRAVLVMEWLMDHGLRPESFLDIAAPAGRVASGDPGVACEFHLEEDKVLRDFYLRLAEGEARADAGTRDTIEFSRWLEENFKCCMH